MQVRFLLGPAGSGKTFRCLAEIRAALASAPDGPPLVLLAPKQATFQLERQLLGDPAPARPGGNGLAGFTRLRVLSFDRLAEFVFDQLRAAPPKLLSAEGRLMVLRALLRRHDGELKLLRGSARRIGFAQELGGQLAELQQHQFGPTRLRALAADETLRRELRDKLHDLALMAEKYAEWLRSHGLQDANCLLDAATDTLRAGLSHGQPPLAIAGLWLDGFAEMTPQEHALLAAVTPFCEQATLAFCLETEPTPDTSWLSIWSAIGKTFQRCRQQLAALPGCTVQTETLPRRPGASRFPDNSALGALEAGWALPFGADAERADLPDQISVTACATPEAEAVFAARALLQFVRPDAGRRFRDCAVLVRNLEPYHQALTRVFRRYEIPFFLDQRESVTHHPLAELTRGALRTVAGDWAHDDWFATLKAGFTPAPETDLDRLENLALEFGWRGKKWREPLPDDFAEQLRQRIWPPFERLYHRLQRLKFEPTGTQLAEAIRELWAGMNVEPTLQQWSLLEAEAATATRQSLLHETVFDQMTAWLENVALAFPREPLPLRDWLPILETGLAGLTVGVIPPALDEVLVGAIDRARNPDLKFALLLGVNESVFPAPPALPVILTRSDRDELDRQNAPLGLDVMNQISREQYLGYIACTRASQKLALVFSRQDAGGRTLNPSPFITRLQQQFPALAIQEFPGEIAWPEAEHAIELVADLVRGNGDNGDTKKDHPSATLPETENGDETSPPSPRPSPPGRGRSCSSVLAEGELPGLWDQGANVSEESGSEPGSSPANEAQTIGPQSCQSLLTSAATVTTEPLPAEILEIPAVKSLADKLARLREPAAGENLPPALAARIYGPVLKSSVSRLEEFAQCPFRFFVRSGLRAEERKQFELDARERGTFQHEILKQFHDELAAENKLWRDLTPAEARARIGRIAAALAPGFRDGLLQADHESRFMARALTAALQDFVETLVTWMREQYDFTPAKAETGFGLDHPGLPDWRIELGADHALALRGRVDRIDVCRDGDRCLTVVMDYKSSARKLDKILVEHGIQLQLLAYLAAVRRWPAEFFGAREIVPAGVFYVNLRGQFESGGSRAEVLADAGAARRLAYRHTGRFDAGVLPRLDRRGARDQFNYQMNADGRVRSNSAEALPRQEFIALLDQVEEQLRTLGRRIFSGETAVDPYRKGAVTACDYCEYQGLCRMDPYTHEFRELRAAPKQP